MADLFQRLVERARAEAALVKPVLGPRFGPTPALAEDGLPEIDERSRVSEGSHAELVGEDPESERQDDEGPTEPVAPRPAERSPSAVRRRGSRGNAPAESVLQRQDDRSQGDDSPAASETDAELPETSPRSSSQAEGTPAVQRSELPSASPTTSSPLAPGTAEELSSATAAATPAEASGTSLSSPGDIFSTDESRPDGKRLPSSPQPDGEEVASPALETPLSEDASASVSTTRADSHRAELSTSGRQGTTGVSEEIPGTRTSERSTVADSREKNLAVGRPPGAADSVVLEATAPSSVPRASRPDDGSGSGHSENETALPEPSQSSRPGAADISETPALADSRQESPGSRKSQLPTASETRSSRLASSEAEEKDSGSKGGRETPQSSSAPDDTPVVQRSSLPANAQAGTSPLDSVPPEERSPVSSPAAPREDSRPLSPSQREIESADESMSDGNRDASSPQPESREVAPTAGGQAPDSSETGPEIEASSAPGEVATSPASRRPPQVADHAVVAGKAPPSAGVTSRLRDGSASETSDVEPDPAEPSTSGGQQTSGTVEIEAGTETSEASTLAGPEEEGSEGTRVVPRSPLPTASETRPSRLASAEAEEKDSGSKRGRETPHSSSLPATAQPRTSPLASVPPEERSPDSSPAASREGSRPLASSRREIESAAESTSDGNRDASSPQPESREAAPPAGGQAPDSSETGPEIEATSAPGAIATSPASRRPPQVADHAVVGRVPPSAGVTSRLRDGSASGTSSAEPDPAEPSTSGGQQTSGTVEIEELPASEATPSPLAPADSEEKDSGSKRGGETPQSSSGLDDTPVVQRSSLPATAQPRTSPLASVPPEERSPVSSPAASREGSMPLASSQREIESAAESTSDGKRGASSPQRESREAAPPTGGQAPDSSETAPEIEAGSAPGAVATSLAGRRPPQVADPAVVAGKAPPNVGVTSRLRDGSASGTSDVESDPAGPSTSGRQRSSGTSAIEASGPETSEASTLASPEEAGSGSTRVERTSPRSSSGPDDTQVLQRSSLPATAQVGSSPLDSVPPEEPNPLASAKAGGRELSLPSSRL